MKLKIDN